MKKLLTAIAALGLVGTPAFAADMAVKAPPPAPEPVYSWTGFYAGVNAGWSWGNDNTTVNFPGPTINSILLSSPNTGSGGESCPLGCTLRQLPIGYQETTHPNGAIGGGQIGYNWQTTSNWIFGSKPISKPREKTRAGTPIRANSF
jgi:outer membrane immunogenic protein